MLKILIKYQLSKILINKYLDEQNKNKFLEKECNSLREKLDKLLNQNIKLEISDDLMIV